MGYIKGYDFDIFISYAHLDNQRLFDEEKGWIECFIANLNKLISQRIGVPDLVKIWWDERKLDGSVLFDQSIENGINKSAILICLNSAAYLKSEYCQKELALFHAKLQQEPAGLQVGEQSRIMHVLLNNISYRLWPPALNGTTGFRFFEARGNEDLGDPVDLRDSHFK